MSFTPVAAEAGAHLSFTTLVAADSVHGAVFDQITLVAWPVPEPQSRALFIAGLVLAGSMVRHAAAARGAGLIRRP